MVLKGAKNSKYKLSRETHSKVNEIAKKLGYRPNRMAVALKNNKTHMIGVLQARFESRTNVSKLDGINKILNKDYSYVTAVHGFDGAAERMHLETFMDCRLDGVIASWSGDPESIEIYRELNERYKIPLVLFDRKIDGLDCPVVGTDHYGVSFKAVESLCGLGHKKILYVSLGKKLSTDMMSAKGYSEAMCKFGNEDDLMVVTPNFKLQQHDPKELRLYADNVLSDFTKKYPGYTAILSQGDLLAHALLDQAHKKGLKIPEDISLMGMGDLYASSLEMVGLSTVTEHLEDIGSMAAKILIEEIDGNHSEQSEYRMPVDVTLRKTTKSI